METATFVLVGTIATIAVAVKVFAWWEGKRRPRL